MRRNHHHPGWDKVRSVKHKVAVSRQFQQHQLRSVLPNTDSKQLERRRQPTTHHARASTTVYHNSSLDGTLVQRARRQSETNEHLLSATKSSRQRAAPVTHFKEFRLPSNSADSSPSNTSQLHTTSISPPLPDRNKEELEQANFEFSALSQQCQEQQENIDTLLSNVHRLQQEDVNRMNEVRNALNNLQNMERKYKEDVSKKFNAQQESHYKRVNRMETSTLKNIKNLHDKLYKSHSTYVAQQTLFIQENIDRTSGKQRRMVISLTSKGVHWLAMGAMTIVNPVFKVLRMCGCKKQQLSTFAKDYLGSEDYVVPD